MDESELSELTEADEDGTPPNIRTPFPTRPASNSHADGPEGPPPRLRKSAAGGKRKSRSRNARKSANAASASSRRKKRGGIVPAPMWDWAYKNGTAETPLGSASGSHPGPPTTVPPATAPHTNPSLNHTATTHNTTTRHPKSESETPDAEEEEEEEEEEEQPAPPRAMEEEEGEEGDPDGRGRGYRVDEDLGDDEDDAMDDRDVDEEDEVPSISSRTRQRPPSVSHRSTSNTSRIRKPRTIKPEINPGKVVVTGPDGAEADEMDVDDVDADDHAEGSATEEGYPDHYRYSNANRAHAKSNRPTALPGVGHWDSHTCRDNDATHEVQVNAQDAILSVPPSRAESPQEHTPEEDDEPNGDTVGDAAEEQEGDGEAVDDEEPSPTEPDDQLGDTPGEVEGDEHPNVQDDRESNLDDPELEAEEPDEDPDLQPAHRAEALDVLATIEIKFAMLRERVYVEKMEGLAWEESLIWEGTHPELHYIQEELTKRRDKRLTLAERKRRYEVHTLERKRKEEEASIWDNWEHTRDRLQTEMMAETNRKRRKLERERRAAERPMPVRRFPVPIRDPPPAPSLREIVNTTPLPSRLAQLISGTIKKPPTDSAINPTLTSRLRFGLNGLGLNATAHPDLPTPSPADIAADLEYIFQHRRAGLGYPYSIFPVAPGVGFPAVGPGIGPGMGFGPSAGGTTTGYNNIPGVPFGMNGFPTGETYTTGVGPGITQPGPVPPPATGTSVPPPHNHVGMTGPGVGPADSAGFGQPSPMGILQPSAGRETVYPTGPGGPSTPGRIPRPSGPPVDREWDQAQRERELVAREHDRELAQQRDREMRERERLGEVNSRGRDREFGPHAAPGYQTSGWNSRPSGSADWGLSDRRRDDDIMDRDREKDLVDRGDRDKSQVQLGSTPAPRSQNQHPHSHSHHPHSAQSPHPHISHSNHQAHSQPHTHLHHQHQHPHFRSHSPHPNLHTQHQHGPTGAAPHHHHVGQHHHRHHHHILHNHHTSGSELRIGLTSGVSVEGPGIRSGQGHQTPTMEIINLSANPSSKTHWKREESKYGGGSIPGSRPSSTHPPFPAYDERDRPVATPFVLGPSQNTVSATSSPRHNWTHGEGGSSVTAGGHGNAFPPPERYHSPVPGGPGTLGMPHRSSNPPPPTHHRRQSPNLLNTSPSRSGPPTSPTNANLPNPIAPSSSMNTSSPGPFVLPRKSSPVLPPPSKLGMPPIVFSPRLTGPGVLPPTGPGIPGMLSGAPTGPGAVVVLAGPSSGPGVPPSSGPGILTSGPGMSPPLTISSSTSGPVIPPPNGPGLIPPSGPGIPPAGPGDGSGVPTFTGSRTASPLISFARTGAPPGQKIGVEGV